MESNILISSGLLSAFVATSVAISVSYWSDRYTAKRDKFISAFESLKSFHYFLVDRGDTQIIETIRSEYFDRAQFQKAISEFREIDEEYQKHYSYFDEDIHREIAEHRQPLLDRISDFASKGIVLEKKGGELDPNDLDRFMSDMMMHSLCYPLSVRKGVIDQINRIKI